MSTKKLLYYWHGGPHHPQSRMTRLQITIMVFIIIWKWELMKLWCLQCSWCLATVNTCRVDLRALLRHHCPARNYALCARPHQRSCVRGLLISSQPESYEEYKWLQHISSWTLRRALRETHAIQPIHTLTRHTSYFSSREITRIASTNLGRYLTVEG